MKYLGVLLIAGLMYATPVWLLDQMVMPELLEFKDVYTNAEVVANNSTGTR